MRAALFCWCAIGLLAQLPVSAAELRIAHGQDKPPFVFGQDQRGLEIDIMREALAYKGHSIEVVHASNKRLQVALQTMGVDGVATVRKSDDSNFYSDDYITFENYAISRESENLKLDKVSDLKGHSIVAWQNAYRDLGPEFEATFNPDVKEPYLRNYMELASQRSQNAMFWLRRAEVIVVDRTIFLWYRKELAKEIDTSAPVRFHNLFPSRTHFQAAFKSQQIRDDFNQGLRHLRESGRYQLLYDYYIK